MATRPTKKVQARKYTLWDHLSTEEKKFLLKLRKNAEVRLAKS